MLKSRRMMLHFQTNMIRTVKTKNDSIGLFKKKKYNNWLKLNTYGIDLIKILFQPLKGAMFIMSYLKIVLRATRPDANLDRAYEIHLYKGLFDSWLVITAYGRYGAKGRGAFQKTHSFFVLEEAKQFIDKTLNKRLNAFKRIGCNYEIIKRSSSADLSKNLI